MGRYPASILGPNEDLVFDLRPHWIALLAPVLQALAMALLLAVLWLVIPSSWWWAYLLTLVAGLVGFGIGPGKAITRWLTSHFVLTTDRIIRREGWIAKEAIEIPLEKISDVRFRQRIVERAVGAGTLIIESAGRSGQERLDKARRPEWIQRTIYEIKERMLARRAEVPESGVPQGWGPASVADELTKLHLLATQGVLTPEEFESAKLRLLRRV
jgi:uncharacterized membrane protein YdbT with pleckstrin-like domain